MNPSESAKIQSEIAASSARQKAIIDNVERMADGDEDLMRMVRIACGEISPFIIGNARAASDALLEQCDKNVKPMRIAGLILYFLMATHENVTSIDIDGFDVEHFHPQS